MGEAAMRVLYVDDDAGIARLVQKAFQRRGYAVEHVASGAEALARLDRRMADRYVALRRALPTAARAALVRDQGFFLGARDQAADDSLADGFPADLAGRMRQRISFLDRLQPAPSSLAGHWSNAFGNVEVRETGGGRISVEIVAAHPVAGRWTCDVSGTGRLSDDVVTISAEDGWRLRLKLRPGYVEVEEIEPADSSERPYCGLNGLVGGTYFRTG